MILVIDNYDSVTYNLVQRLGEIDDSLDIQVRRNDKVTVEELKVEWQTGDGLFRQMRWVEVEAYPG